MHATTTAVVKANVWRRRTAATTHASAAQVGAASTATPVNEYNSDTQSFQRVQPCFKKKSLMT